jgi:hypothetical protein
MTETTPVVEATTTNTERRVITIKRTQLALFKGLGKDLNFIATHFGITTNEAKNLMEQAGLLVKRKTNTSTSEYSIQYVDDVTFSENA